MVMLAPPALREMLQGNLNYFPLNLWQLWSNSIVKIALFSRWQQFESSKMSLKIF